MFRDPPPSEMNPGAMPSQPEPMPEPMSQPPGGPLPEGADLDRDELEVVEERRRQAEGKTGGKSGGEAQKLEPSLKPLNPQAFGEAQARHLLWRAGFGGNEAQVRTLVSWGLKKSVDYLVDYGAVDYDTPSMEAWNKDIIRPYTPEEQRMAAAARRGQDENTLSQIREERQRRERLDREQMGKIQQWWLTRMIETPRPLEEKLTLFWHGHFATSFRGVEDSYHMFMQNQLFRRNAAGNFGELLMAIIRDPAMLAYLNNNQSRKGQPNENLAREIMELFSLGIGNYTEKDIKDGARALTGYTYEDDTFNFNRRNHDTGSKTILGKSGGFDGDDFVRAILAKRQCARFITRKLYDFFVSEVPPEERGGEKSLELAQRSVLAEMATTMVVNRYSIRPVLRRLFMSAHFYEARFMNNQIKSPAALVVGAIRTLNTPTRDLSTLNDAMDLMGQRLFMPPSVKGWTGGRTWINTSTLFVRQNIMAYLLTGKRPQGRKTEADGGPDSYNALGAFAELGGRDVAPGELAERVLMVTLGSAPSEAKNTLAQVMPQRGPVTNQTLISMLLLATAMPEYQLC